MSDEIDALRIQLDAALGTIYHLERHFTVESQRGAVRHRDRHGYIPYPPRDFMKKMYMASRLYSAMRGTRASRFLDVGCGVGTKVFIAAHLFTHVAGLEIDWRLLKVARRLNEASYRRNSTFIRHDALTYADYGRYDVLFLYGPFRDPGKQAALERRIVEQVPSRTILVASQCSLGELPPKLRPEEVLPEIYLTRPRSHSPHRWPRALQLEIEALSQR